MSVEKFMNEQDSYIIHLLLMGHILHYTRVMSYYMLKLACTNYCTVN